MKTVFDFLNPSPGKTYSHINPWYAVMEHVTDEIEWPPPVSSAGRSTCACPDDHVHSAFNTWTRKTMKTVFDFLNPSWGKTASHVNPWYAAMEHVTDEIEWKTPVSSAGRITLSSADHRTHNSVG